MVDINIKNNRIGSISSNSVNEVLRRNAADVSFETLLKKHLDTNSSLQFSKHAKERIGQRGIEITETLMSSLERAVSQARDKGVRDAVIIDSSGAFIVSVPNNTVITAMSGSEMKGNIFTNIDSAVII